jgi:hypothetical protein
MDKNKKKEEIAETEFEEVKSVELDVTDSDSFSDKQLYALKSFATILADILLPSLSKGILDFIPQKGTKSKTKEEKKKSMEEKKIELVKNLIDSGIDLKIFDSLISNEINRRLKIRFGVTFLVFTFIVTLASYLIVILDAIYKWGISQVAITALIIEIPIQFIGLLYIIAKNLFPDYLDKK